MSERSTALTALTLDGSPVVCQHAVLITSDGPDATGTWSVVLLGLSRWDLQRLGARSRFEAAGSLGERFSGTAQVAGSPSRFHVRLEGQGPLRQLAPLPFTERDPTRPRRSDDGRSQMAAKRRGRIDAIRDTQAGMPDLRVVDVTAPATSTASASGARDKTGLRSRGQIAAVKQLHLVRNPHRGKRDPA